MTTPSGLPPSGERFTATRQRESFGHLVAAFFIAVAIVMLVARLFGTLAVKIHQPRVMGEVVAGITLGPTILGWIAPSVQAAMFPSDILPAFGIAANLGLIFYMFLVGLEIDVSQLKGRIGQAAAISNTSVALPMMLGIAVALPLYPLLAPDKKFVAFAVFMGVAMSITAFPVLARILVERRMLKRPVGALTLACAAIDDVTAWFLIALATAVATSGTGGEVARTIALAIAFTLFMALLVRPLLGRVSNAYDEAGTRARRLDCRDLRRRAAVRVRHRGDRHRRHLRRLHRRHDHAAPCGPDGGRHEADRGLRHRPPAADVLRLHRPPDQRRACSTGRSCGGSPAC